MTDQIQRNVTDRILTLTINRPEKKNALTSAMYAALAEGIISSSLDNSVRAIVITGTEDSFTAGNDLLDFIEKPPTGPSSPVFKFMHAIAGAAIPIVAAVNGLAIGIGTTMLLHCDLVYANKTSKFQLPFVNLGLVPELGSSLLLPALAGRARAAELLMLGEPFDAITAREIGLVNAMCAPDNLLVTARAAAANLAGKPPSALRQTKALLIGNISAIRQRIDQEAVAFLERLDSAEVKEAIAAFSEKRSPDFSKFD